MIPKNNSNIYYEVIDSLFCVCGIKLHMPSYILTLSSCDLVFMTPLAHKPVLNADNSKNFVMIFIKIELSLHFIVSNMFLNFRKKICRRLFEFWVTYSHIHNENDWSHNCRPNWRKKLDRYTIALRHNNWKRRITKRTAILNDRECPFIGWAQLRLHS